MKQFIKHKLREQLNAVDSLCNRMSVDTYEDGIKYITAFIGTPEQSPQAWQSITKPLQMWRKASNQINKEMLTGMSGDSNVDESDTWWSGIQGTLCPRN